MPTHTHTHHALRKSEAGSYSIRISCVKHKMTFVVREAKNVSAEFHFVCKCTIRKWQVTFGEQHTNKTNKKNNISENGRLSLVCASKAKIECVSSCLAFVVCRDVEESTKV